MLENILFLVFVSELRDKLLLQFQPVFTFCSLSVSSDSGQTTSSVKGNVSVIYRERMYMYI